MTFETSGAAVASVTKTMIVFYSVRVRRSKAQQKGANMDGDEKPEEQFIGEGRDEPEGWNHEQIVVRQNEDPHLRPLAEILFPPRPKPVPIPEEAEEVLEVSPKLPKTSSWPMWEWSGPEWFSVLFRATIMLGGVIVLIDNNMKGETVSNRDAFLGISAGIWFMQMHNLATGFKMKKP